MISTRYVSRRLKINLYSTCGRRVYFDLLSISALIYYCLNKK
ncbi:hypothetical protein ETAE_2692 [Edwardsiella piscicida]|uniref:Transposase n=1 Tax=Edwardsiella piscicida TaxID=1263550 RepID=A0AAU8P780_EDWPI|nr:hypothetical protein ETAE_2692 [Edwardsiella tarda EIB202]